MAMVALTENRNYHLNNPNREKLHNVIMSLFLRFAGIRKTMTGN